MLRGAVELLVTSAPTFEAIRRGSAAAVRHAGLRRQEQAAARHRSQDIQRCTRTVQDRLGEEALKKFDLVVTLTSSSPFKDTSDAEDLRTLASGFIELASAGAPDEASAGPEAPKR